MEQHKNSDNMKTQTNVPVLALHTKASRACPSTCTKSIIISLGVSAHAHCTLAILFRLHVEFGIIYDERSNMNVNPKQTQRNHQLAGQIKAMK